MRPRTRRSIPTAGSCSSVRDSPSAEMQADKWWITSSPHTYADTIRKSGVGILAATNWSERWTKYGAFYKVNNLPGQVKVLALGEQQKNVFAGETSKQFKVAKPFEFLGPSQL